MTNSILNFMNGEVSQYLIPDIERLTALRPQGAKGTAGCTIPTAMFLFAITDLFGFLIRDDCRKPKLEDTKGNLEAIFSHPLKGHGVKSALDSCRVKCYRLGHGTST